MSEYQANIITRNPATPGGPSPLGAAPGVWRLNDVAGWIKQGVWPDTNVDPYWAYLSLLLSTTSLSNANNNLFVDSSGAFNPVSRNGNTTQGSFTPYSTNWSNYFDGSGDYLQTPSNSAFALGTGDYTVECWIYATSTPSDVGIYEGRSTGSATDGFTLTAFSGSVIRIYCGSVLISSSGTSYVNQWTHVAVTRASGTTTLWINGVSQGTSSTSYNCTNTDAVVGGGRYSSGSSVNTSFPGYISNFRIVKGTAVYTGAFTPPASPLTAISGTSLLTCQSNRFRDASTNNFTITVAGNTSVQEFNPFILYPSGITYNQSDITNWSGYFDGSGDYLTVPYSTALQFPGDFTVECWVYLNSRVTSFPCIVSNYSIYTSNGGFAIFAGHSNSSTKYQVSFNGSFPVITSSSTVVYGAWTHIALVRSGSTLTLYINGVSEGTASNSATVTGTTNNWWIGSSGDSTSASYINGYISNLRAVKGTAVYTGNFTPPTTNLTAISGTSLLTLQNAAFTDNSTNNFVITPYDNTTVTGNSPFNTTGYWSNYFDGSGDYLYAPNNTALDIWDNGTGSFTVEAWIFATASIPNNVSIVGKASLNGSTPFDGWAFQVFSGYLNVNTASNNRLFTNTTAVPLNQWVHVALVKSGTTVSIYQNGTRVSTITSSTAYSNTTDQLHIATDRNPGGSTFPGYISNLRMVKGTAVYDPSQASITVPTTPLTAVTNTSLLTCQNGRFIDNSTNAFAITAYGNTSTQSFDPFYTATIASNGGSMYFDNTGDYLAIPASPSLAFGTGNFTLEAWVYGSGAWSTDPIFECRASGGSSSGYAFLVNSSGYLNVYTAGAFVGNSSTTLNLNSWNHVALVRTGTGSNQTTYYINGVASGTITLSGNFTDAITNETKIGGSTTAGEIWNGYIASARITKAAVYTAAFTPSTTPLTPSANTVLLVNGMNAGIYDATTINNLETVGNAQVTTAVSKFGGSSIAFDGSGDGILTTNSVTAYSPRDFTWECWVNFNSLSGNPCILAITSAPDRTLLYFNATTGINFVINRSVTDFVTVAQGSTAGWSTGVWYHVAVVRNGTSFNIYRDGVSVASTTSSYIEPSLNAPITVGYSNYSASYLYFNGYIDEVRITNGVARYTANFTPPTQAFPVY